MKNLFKLTTAALALVAFASCSNDEFPNTQQAQPTTDFASVFEYEMEAPEFDGVTGTRAARNANGGGFVYQKGDQLRVYDEDLGTFDPYEFDTKFGRKNAKSNLKKDPKYALFPAEDVRKGYCDGEGNHIAEIKIGTRKNPGAANQFNVIEYSNAAGSETKEGETVVYQCDIPMWGEVVKVDDKTVKTKTALSPLSGVLMLTLGKTMGNATWIKLHSDKGYLGGTFYANLDDAEPALYINDANEYVDLTRDLYIDLRDVPSDKAVLYIPVVAGINDLKVFRTDETGDDPTLVTWAWTPVTNESGYTFKRNGWHKVDYEYPIVAQTPEEISIVLAQLSKQTENLNLALTKNALDLTKVTKKEWKGIAAGSADKTVYMPAMSAEVVTIDIAKDLTAVSPKNLLNFEDADDANPFTGTLVIKSNPITPVSKQAVVNINLPKANIVMVGKFSPSGTEWVVETVKAQTFTLGDAATTTELGYGTAKIDVSEVVKAIDVTAKAKLVCTKFDAQKNALSDFPTITINGSVDGNIDTKGDVIINQSDLTATAAITGDLTFYRGGTTATIKNGYVGKITNNFNDLGEANNHTVTVNLDDANGVTAIKNVKVDGSKWADAAINLTESTLSSNATPDGGIANYIADNGAENYTIYTASQLQYVHNKKLTTAVGLTFGNNLNMAKAAWKAPFGNGTTAAQFDIASTAPWVTRTIKNLSYNKYENTVKGIGFVGHATTLNVSDFALENVSFNRAYVDDESTTANKFEVAFVGAIAGKATTTANITRTTVKLADNFGYKAYTLVSTGDKKAKVNVNPQLQGIGGLVGITGKADLSRVSVSGNLIEGYTSLGGFIGRAWGDVDIDGFCKSQIKAFKSNYSDPAATNIEMNFARIGGGIGYQASNSAYVKVLSGASTSTVSVTLPAGGEDKLYVKVAAGTGNKLYSFSRNQQWVGFSGTEDDPEVYGGTVTIGDPNYVSPKFDTDGSLKSLGTDLPLYTWTAKAN